MMESLKSMYDESKHHARDDESEGYPLLTGIATGICLAVLATAFLGAPGTRGAVAAGVALLATSVLYYKTTDAEEKPLREFYPRELLAADESEIDWDALVQQIGKTRRDYEHPTTPEGDDGPWLDRLELCGDVARHVRDGGRIDVDEVLGR